MLSTIVRGQCVESRQDYPHAGRYCVSLHIQHLGDVVDLGGVTDATVGGSPGGHLDKHVQASLIVARNPDAIVLHSRSAPEVDSEGRLVAFDGYPVEARVADMPWVRERFRVGRIYAYAPNYYYVLMLRTPGPNDR